MRSIPFLLANTTGNFILPAGTSTIAKEVDFPFYFISGVSAFFFLLIMTLIVIFVKKYRHKEGGTKADINITHNTMLELAWSIIPLILLVVIFALGYRSYLKMVIPPANALEINVTGQKWNWSFNYPGVGAESSAEEGLAVPKGRDIQLRMTSTDVIHSFFVPNFRLKADVLPGRYTKISFKATEEGTYQVFCAEYCGTLHSAMISKVIVLNDKDYEEWIVKHQAKVNPIERGQQLFKQNCASCHAVKSKAEQPEPNIGPRLYQRFGTPENVLVNGNPGQKKTITIDENYIRESISNSNATIVEGFAYPSGMPTFQGRFSEKDMSALIAYIKSLK